jgi:hypothetical protein
VGLDMRIQDILESYEDLPEGDMFDGYGDCQRCNRFVSQTQNVPLMQCCRCDSVIHFSCMLGNRSDLKKYENAEPHTFTHFDSNWWLYRKKQRVFASDDIHDDLYCPSCALYVKKSQIYTKNVEQQHFGESYEDLPDGDEFSNNPICDLCDNSMGYVEQICDCDAIYCQSCVDSHPEYFKFEKRGIGWGDYLGMRIAYERGEQIPIEHTAMTQCPNCTFKARPFQESYEGLPEGDEFGDSVPAEVEDLFWVLSNSTHFSFRTGNQGDFFVGPFNNRGVTTDIRYFDNHKDITNKIINHPAFEEHEANNYGAFSDCLVVIRTVYDWTIYYFRDSETKDYRLHLFHEHED